LWNFKLNIQNFYFTKQEVTCKSSFMVFLTARALKRRRITMVQRGQGEAFIKIHSYYCASCKYRHDFVLSLTLGIGIMKLNIF
jgi:hypothetical protein